MKKEKKDKENGNGAKNKTGKTTKESIATGKKAIMVKKILSDKDKRRAENDEKKDAARWRNEG